MNDVETAWAEGSKMHYNCDQLGPFNIDVSHFPLSPFVSSDQNE